MYFANLCGSTCRISLYIIPVLKLIFNWGTFKWDTLYPCDQGTAKLPEVKFEVRKQESQSSFSYVYCVFRFFGPQTLASDNFTVPGALMVNIIPIEGLKQALIDFCLKESVKTSTFKVFHLRSKYPHFMLYLPNYY